MSEEQKNTILIVDDENINLTIMTHILSETYNIYTATNGLDGIKIAKKHLPDLILLDIAMPEIDGYETLIRLKACEETKHIPVIIITGFSGIEDEEKCLRLNAADYITRPFSDMIVILRVRNQIQIINQLRTIQQLSMFDELTKISNRRSFNERLQLEWKHAIREKSPISILMMDIDNFKVVNDTYGHQQGDIVLKNLAKHYPLSFKRSSDFAARWGGEEFIALLPNTDHKGAINVAEHIRRNTEKRDIRLDNGITLNITVSIGVNSLIPQQNSKVEDFILNADKALYAAKAAGKNKVMAHDC